MESLGTLLPIAAAIALSPLPIIAAVLVAGSPRAGTAGPAFAIGTVLGLAVLAAASILLLSQVGETGPVGQALLDWLRIAVGLLLLWAAYRKWQGRPRGDEMPPIPKWLAAFDDIAPAAAFRTGAAVAALNPKHVGLMLAAVAALSDAPTQPAEDIVTMILLVALSAVPVVSIVLWRAFGGPGTAARLDALKQFMLRNSSIIVMVVFVLIGASVLGNGISGLTG